MWSEGMMILLLLKTVLISFPLFALLILIDGRLIFLFTKNKLLDIVDRPVVYEAYV